MRQKAFARSAVKLAVAALLVFAVLGLMGCYYMPGVARPGGTARASIGVGKSIPAGTMSVVLIVGGPGMDTIADTYPVGSTTATITVPSGAARTFTLLANTPSVTFRDDVTVDLTAGETKSIALNAVLATSQIIVPDTGNSSLVQISDMKGTAPTTLSVVQPYDVDFDDQGRIYVTNGSGIDQMSDISGTNLKSLSITATGVQSIAMDRARGLLYYVGNNANGFPALWRIQVTPTQGTETLIDTSTALGSFSSTGIAVDSDGDVYLATGTPSVVKIDPNTGPAKLLATYTGILTSPYDVLVKGDDVYVSDTMNYVQGKIVHMSKNLTPIDEFSGPSGDPFYGPERFVAILNKPITVIDETRYAEGNRLVAFADMTGAGWTTYEPRVFNPNLGMLVDQFEFLFNNSGG